MEGGTMTEERKPVRLAGRELDGRCHACAFFHNREEEYQLLLPFVKQGFERGDRAFQIVDPRHRQERLQRLKNADIDVDAATHTGQLELRTWDEAQFRTGRFDQNAMLALIEEVLTSGKAGGYRLTRFWANMEWALEDRPGLEDFVEFETRVNYLLPRYDDALVCTYDLNRFSATVVMDILRTHPMVIVGSILQENPFYVPPDQFLRELRERRAQKAPS
jgi:MEDS: MEthanogen/methylotroph, DcmR Sensory domain